MARPVVRPIRFLAGKAVDAVEPALRQSCGIILPVLVSSRPCPSTGRAQSLFARPAGPIASNKTFAESHSDQKSATRMSDPNVGPGFSDQTLSFKENAGLEVGRLGHAEKDR